MQQETVKLLNVLRRIARAAGYAAWIKAGPDATQFCVAQYNRVLARLSELGIIAGPGEFYGDAASDHVRIALTATDERIAAAAERLSQAAG